jgi:hypothetical protein
VEEAVANPWPLKLSSGQIVQIETTAKSIDQVADEIVKLIE